MNRSGRDSETSFSSSVGSSDLSDCEGESTVSSSDDGGWILKSAPRREAGSTSLSPIGVVPVPDAVTPIPIRQSMVESSQTTSQPEDVWVVESVKPITKTVEWLPPKRHTTPIKDRGYLNATASHDSRKTVIQQHQTNKRTNSPASHRAGGNLRFGGWHPAPNNTAKVPVVGGSPVVRLTRTQLIQSNSRTNTPVRRAPPPPASQARIRTQTPTRATPNRTTSGLRTASPATSTSAVNRTMSPGVSARGGSTQKIKTETNTPTTTTRGRTVNTSLSGKRLQSPATRKVARSLTEDLSQSENAGASHKTEPPAAMTRKDSVTQIRRYGSKDSKQSLRTTEDSQSDQIRRTNSKGAARKQPAAVTPDNSFKRNGTVTTSKRTPILKPKSSHDSSLIEEPKTPKQVASSRNVCYTNTITRSQHAQEPSPLTPRAGGVRTPRGDHVSMTPEIVTSPSTPHRLSNTAINKRYSSAVVESSKLLQMLNKKEAAAAAKSAATPKPTEPESTKKVTKRSKSIESSSSLSESENTIPESVSVDDSKDVDVTLDEEILLFLFQDEEQSRVNIFEDEYRIRSSITIMSGNMMSAYSPPRTKTPARKYVRPEVSSGSRLPPMPSHFEGQDSEISDRSLTPHLAWNHKSESPPDHSLNSCYTTIETQRLPPPPSHPPRSGYSDDYGRRYMTSDQGLPAASVEYTQKSRSGNINIEKDEIISDSTDHTQSTRQPSQVYSDVGRSTSDLSSSQHDRETEHSITYTLSEDHVPVPKPTNQLSDIESSQSSSDSSSSLVVERRPMILEHDLDRLTPVNTNINLGTSFQGPKLNIDPNETTSDSRRSSHCDGESDGSCHQSHLSSVVDTQLRLSPNCESDSPKPPRSPRLRQLQRVDSDNVGLDLSNSILPPRSPRRIDSPSPRNDEIPLQRHYSHDDEMSENNFHKSQRSASTVSLGDSSPERDFQGIVMEEPRQGDFYNFQASVDSETGLAHLLDGDSQPSSRHSSPYGGNHHSSTQHSNVVSRVVTRLIIRSDKKQLEIIKDESYARRRILKNIGSDPELGGDTAVVSSPVFARRRMELQREQDLEIENLNEQHNSVLSKEQDFLLSVDENSNEAEICRTRMRQASTTHYSVLAALRSDHAKSQARLWSQPSPNKEHHNVILNAIKVAESDHRRTISEIEDKLHQLDNDHDDLSIGDSSITISVSETGSSTDDEVLLCDSQSQSVDKLSIKEPSQSEGDDQEVQEANKSNEEVSRDDIKLDTDTESRVSEVLPRASDIEEDREYTLGRKAYLPTDNKFREQESDLPVARTSLIEFRDDYLNQQFSNLGEIEFYNRKVLSEEEATSVASIFNLMHSCLLQLVLNRHKRHPSASVSSSVVSSATDGVAKNGSPVLSETMPQKINRSESPTYGSRGSSWASRESSGSPQTHIVHDARFTISRSRSTPSPNHSAGTPNTNFIQGTQRSIDSGSPRFSISPSDASRSPSAESSVKPFRKPPPPPHTATDAKMPKTTSPKKEEILASKYGNLNSLDYGTIGIRGKLPRRKSITSELRTNPTIVVRSPSVEEVLERESREREKITPPAPMAEYAIPRSSVSPDNSDCDDVEAVADITLPKHSEPKWKQIIDNLHTSTGPVRQIFDRMQKEQSQDRTAHRNNLISRLRNELKEAADKDREPLHVAPSTVLLNTFKHRQINTKGMRKPRSTMSQLTTQTGTSSLSAGYPVWKTGPGFRGSGDLGYGGRSPSPPIQERAFTRSSPSKP